MHIHSFTNSEAGTTAFVNTTSLGFSVTLRDDESGEFFPSAMFYTTENEAIAKAKEISAS